MLVESVELPAAAADVPQIWVCALSTIGDVDWCNEMCCGRKFIEFRPLHLNKDSWKKKGLYIRDSNTGSMVP